MPRPLLYAYADAMTSVRAAESLSRVVDHKAALPAPRESARDHIRRLERDATSHEPARPADPARLRAAGIQVERVPRKGGEH